MITSGPFAVPHVVVRIEGAAGRITLNRPKALNALSLGMVRSMMAALRMFEANEGVRVVIVDGSGDRGLCAGGDIREVHDSIERGDDLAATFWREEYTLNSHIARFPKPYIALMDGLVFGGGVGISAHGSHRIVTERTLLAMPEVTIGFIPDVGGTWLLSRTPGELGTYLALTGCRIGAGDARTARLADYMVAAGRLPALAEDLCAASYGHDAKRVADRIIAAHASEPAPSALSKHRRQIDAAFRFDSVEEILDCLDGCGEHFLHVAASRIRMNSPSCLKIALRALRKARRLASLDECLAMEYRVGQRLAISNDFLDGVRAVVIDKNGTPRWRPAELSGVSDRVVEEHFEQLGEKELWVMA